MHYITRSLDRIISQQQLKKKKIVTFFSTMSSANNCLHLNDFAAFSFCLML